jgi:hypothetical protein
MQHRQGFGSGFWGWQQEAAAGVLWAQQHGGVEGAGRGGRQQTLGSVAHRQSDRKPEPASSWAAIAPHKTSVKRVRLMDRIALSVAHLRHHNACPLILHATFGDPGFSSSAGVCPMPLTLSGTALAAGEDMGIFPAKTRG